MFDISFSELLVFGTVALLVLGPDKLPAALRTAGRWIATGRRLTTNLREQSLAAMRIADASRSNLLQPDASWIPDSPILPAEGFAPDIGREYPIEGPDHYGALPEDLAASQGPGRANAQHSPAIDNTVSAERDVDCDAGK